MKKSSNDLKILKFGGTSMGSHESLQKVAQIVADNFQNNIPQVIVCSAMSGVTDQLFKIGDLAENQNLEKAMDIYRTIKKLHFDTAQSFGVADTFRISIDKVFHDLEDLIKGLSLIHELSPRSKACLTAFGEKLSTRLLTEILKTKAVTAIQMDSDFILTNGKSFTEDDIQWAKTNQQILETMTPVLKNKQVPVVTGFFGRNQKGNIALLGRGGSDYSAAILSVGLKTPIVEIWTDVDGFLTADPRIVPEARVIDEIGFTEASELCSFGAKVLHPKTIRPVIDKGGTVWIKNTFNADHPGTKIMAKAENNCHIVLSISSKEAVILSLDLFGVEIGKHKSDVYREIFEICNRYAICIDMIAASEAEISFCIPRSLANKKRFIRDLERVAPLTIQKDRAIICVVSPVSVKGKVGVASEFFLALKEANISLEMYSQNSLEVAQLMVVDRKHEKKAIQVIHDKFSKGSCWL